MSMPSIIRSPWQHRNTLAAMLVIGLAGTVACGSDDAGSGSTDSDPSSTTEPTSGATTDPITESTLPSTSTDPTTPITEPTPVNTSPGSGVVALDAAIADLVTRLDLDDDSTIETVVVEEVTWPDRSLGCPQEGMQYPQVLTPGIRIVLAHDGKQYAYHGGSGRAPVYCASPLAPVAD